MAACATQGSDSTDDRARVDDFKQLAQASDGQLANVSLPDLDWAKAPVDVLEQGNSSLGVALLAKGCRGTEDCGVCSWWVYGDVPHGCSWCGDYWTCW